MHPIQALANTVHEYQNFPEIQDIDLLKDILGELVSQLEAIKSSVQLVMWPEIANQIQCINTAKELIEKGGPANQIFQVQLRLIEKIAKDCLPSSNTRRGSKAEQILLVPFQNGNSNAHPKKMLSELGDIARLYQDETNPIDLLSKLNRFVDPLKSIKKLVSEEIQSKLSKRLASIEATRVLILGIQPTDTQPVYLIFHQEMIHIEALTQACIKLLDQEETISSELNLCNQMENLNFHSSADDLEEKKRPDLYHSRSQTWNLDSARQSQIEAQRSERGGHSKTMADEEDRFREVAASPNSKFWIDCGIVSSTVTPEIDPILYLGILDQFAFQLREIEEVVSEDLQLEIQKQIESIEHSITLIQSGKSGEISFTDQTTRLQSFLRNCLEQIAERIRAKKEPALQLRSTQGASCEEKKVDDRPIEVSDPDNIPMQKEIMMDNLERAIRSSNPILNEHLKSPYVYLLTPIDRMKFLKVGIETPNPISFKCLIGHYYFSDLSEEALQLLIAYAFEKKAEAQAQMLVDLLDRQEWMTTPIQGASLGSWIEPPPPTPEKRTLKVDKLILFKDNESMGSTEEVEFLEGLRKYYRTLFAYLKKTGDIPPSIMEEPRIVGKNGALILAYRESITELIRGALVDENLITTWVHFNEIYDQNQVGALVLLKGMIEGLKVDEPLSKEHMDNLEKAIISGEANAIRESIRTLPIHEITEPDKLRLLKLGADHCPIDSFTILLGLNSIKNLSYFHYTELIVHAKNKGAIVHVSAIEASDGYKLSRFELPEDEVIDLR